MRNFSIEKNHPSLAGHFPGNPIIPGVVILQHVITSFNKTHPKQCIHELMNVKFRQPMSIEIESEIEFVENAGNQFQFQIKQNKKLIASGSFITEGQS